ncbi:acyloxyacyl hydrolase [Carboxylicivirga sediminis]|uniref:Acyloxyacyl hydrolase n=1 Tax=Carboxylicivirga sediminis TaxID=2006564 RepID=A0A941F7S1_9BACT|nr:acyloxyacyl hydrolase [Carboxylicivirga sediminis]MBR8538192.1 acyloxyacyl hydrolase [Carboxylicivirga sediminis]
MLRLTPHIKFDLSIICLCLILNSISAFTQINQSDAPVFYGISAYYGQFQVHTKSLYPYNGTHPYGVEFELSQLLLRDNIRETFGTFIKWGVGLNYVNFDHSDLGFALTGMAYIEPFIRSGRRWRYSLKAGMGVAFMSHPYHPASNPQNLTYSTQLAFPLFGGGSVYYFFTNEWAIKATASFQHISNGGIKQPNLGINYPVIALGVEHTMHHYTIPPPKRLHHFKKETRMDILMGYSLKEDTTHTNDQNVITGFVNRSWQVSRINAITGSFFIEYQESSEITSNKDQWSIAPLVGNEFILGKLYFGQQIGAYLLKGQKAPNLLLQNYYLRAKINAHFIAGVNLKAHGRVADFLSVQLGFTF